MRVINCRDKNIVTQRQNEKRKNDTHCLQTEVMCRQTDAHDMCLLCFIVKIKNSEYCPKLYDILFCVTFYVIIMYKVYLRKP